MGCFMECSKKVSLKKDMLTLNVYMPMCNIYYRCYYCGFSVTTLVNSVKIIMVIDINIMFKGINKWQM